MGLNLARLKGGSILLVVQILVKMSPPSLTLLTHPDLMLASLPFHFFFLPFEKPSPSLITLVLNPV